MITKETARKIKTCWGERGRVCGVDKKKEEHGGKKAGGRT